MIFIKLICVSFFVLFTYSNLCAYTYSIENKFKINLDFKEEIRYEYWDTFDTGATGKDEYYSFSSSKMRFGIGVNTAKIDTYFQLHWSQLFNIPDKAQFGAGALYYKFNHSQNAGAFAISQLWINIKPTENIKLKLGRFFYSSGGETGNPKDPSIKWVKKTCVSGRLINPCEWPRAGRSFDGGVLSYENNSINLTFSYFMPTPGGFYLHRNDSTANDYSSYDIKLATAVLSLKDTNTYIPNLDAQIFYYYYNDNRKINTTTSAPYTAEILGLGDSEIHTLGGHLIYVYPTNSGKFDFFLWGAYQWGSWGRSFSGNDEVLDHEAYALAIEGGYMFKKLSFKPWFRIGYFYGSGDDNPYDKTHNTFFMLIPTVRLISLTPSYTLMNTNYWMTQIILQPHKKILIRSDYHIVKLSEREDFWYLSSGMMRPDNLSYLYKSSYNKKDLLKMWDLSIFIKDIYKYKSLKVDFDFYFSHIWGDDVIRKNYPKDNNLNLIYGEFRISF